MKILPKKYIKYVFPFVVSIVISFIMSWYFTFLNIGFTAKYFQNWMFAWPKAFIIALPVAYFIIPFIRKTIDKVSY